MTDITIPISTVELGEEEEDLVLEVLRSGMLAQGPMVARLEAAFRELTGARHALAVNNGTTALVASMQALELSPGDEVLTSPFTFVATLNAILETGATARFADIGPEDFNIDPDVVADRIGPRTRVLMPVHLYGQAAPMGPLVALAGSVGATIVEDAAQAHGAEIDGQPVGRYGLGCFSLYATKNVTTGEGGIITTDDDRLADRVRLLRNQGMRERYRYEIPGHNYRMTDLQAAVGIPQMARLDTLSAARRRHAAILSEGLEGLDGLITPVEVPGRLHVFHQYTVRVTEDAPISRDRLVDDLAAKGVGAGIYYPRAVYDYDCYRAHPGVVIEGSPVAEQVSREVVSLPVHPRLTDAQLEQVVAAVRSAFGV